MSSLSNSDMDVEAVNLYKQGLRLACDLEMQTQEKALLYDTAHSKEEEKKSEVASQHQISELSAQDIGKT